MRFFRKPKPAPPPLAPPTLYFAGWGFNDREDENVYRDEGMDVLVVEAAGQSFILRKMNTCVCFRRRDDTDERACLFLLNKTLQKWRDEIKAFAPEEFMEEYAKRAYGRLFVYVADCMREYQCVFLCCAPDGTGFSLDYTEERLVDFRWQDVTTMTWPELLAADPEALRPFCKTVFDTLIHSRLTNPYIDPAALKAIPHEFVCGSEAQLRRLTTLIVQTEPEIFNEERKPVIITYRAQTPTKRAYMMKAQWGNDYINYAKRITQNLGRLQSLCDLALRLNTFTGVKWTTWVEKPNRLGHFMKEVQQVQVEVPPPSAHERAEALLSLSDWLEGKVREEKRLRLLGVADE